MSRDGRVVRDVMLGLMKTCQKLGLSFYHYLGDRLVSATSANRFHLCRRSFSLGLEYLGPFRLGCATIVAQ